MLSMTSLTSNFRALNDVTNLVSRRRKRDSHVLMNSGIPQEQVLSAVEVLGQ